LLRRRQLMRHDIAAARLIDDAAAIEMAFADSATPAFIAAFATLLITLMPPATPPLLIIIAPGYAFADTQMMPPFAFASFREPYERQSAFYFRRVASAIEI
jgi:hypothetical protein